MTGIITHLGTGKKKNKKIMAADPKSLYYGSPSLAKNGDPPMVRRTVIVVAAALFAAVGIAVGCVDLRDHLKVAPTESPSEDILSPSDEPLTINQAKREVEVVVDATKRWVEWREQDIAKREQLVAFIEGFSSSGLAAISETAGTWAGPLAPLVTLLVGYGIKRRGDKTSEDYRRGKEDSYNEGIEVGKKLADIARSV